MRHPVGRLVTRRRSLPVCGPMLNNDTLALGPVTARGAPVLAGGGRQQRAPPRRAPDLPSAYGRGLALRPAKAVGFLVRWGGPPPVGPPPPPKRFDAPRIPRRG